MNIFVNVLTFYQYFLCMGWWFSRYFKRFSMPYTNIYFLFASLKLHSNSVNANWNHPQNSFLCDWSMFFRVDHSVVAGKNKIVTGGFRYAIIESQVVSCTHFSVKISALGSVKRVTERIFKISKYSNFKVWFLIKEETKNCKKNQQRVCRKYQLDIISLNKNIYLVTQSL